MENVACDFCGSREATAVARQTDFLHRTTDEVFTIVRCNGCGLHYTNPRPAPDEIGRYYAEAYSFHAAPGALRRLADDLLTTIANSPLAPLGALPGVSRRLAARVKPRIADPVRRHLAPGARRRVLDIGCGGGASAHFWGERGALLAYRALAEVSGVEVDEGARQVLAAAGIPAHASLDAVPAEARFDVIRMNWSLEHVHSPARYFEFIARRLAAGGKAVIAIPNYDGLLYRLAPDCVEVPIHLYHFRRQDILNYAQRVGLQELEFHSFSYPEMYVAAAADCPSLKGLFAHAPGVLEARQMQRLLARFDALGLGNDMLFVLAPAA